jgi:hypothetical protein
MLNHDVIKRSLAGGLVIAAAGFPVAAQARYVEDPGPQSASSVVTAGPPPPSPVAATPSSQSGGSSFQWGDAGIGAAGASVLLGAGALGAGMIRRRRRVAVR